MLIGLGGNGGGIEFEYKHIIWALIIMITLPIILPLVAPAAADGDWEEEIQDLEDTYYRQSGRNATANINIWALSGIYTPYTGTTHGRTSDGWLYGELVDITTPSQYSAAYWSGEQFTAELNRANGLYYYTSAPSNVPDIVAASGSPLDFTGATIYSSVTMDKAHKSDVFFSTGGKTTTSDGYYYEYTGYRYAFRPLSDYTTTKDGVTYEVSSYSSSCSLVWYEYVTLDGIAGQLTVSGTDYGVSYLTSDDIIRAYNTSNYSARFDMMFGNIPMHLLITLNPTAVAAGLTIPEIWNGGYWSVMVYSDQDATSSTLSQTWEFSPDKILDTVIKLFMFDIEDEYDLDGWVAILASATFTVAMYAALLALALNHAYLWILVAAIAAIQSFNFLGL